MITLLALSLLFTPSASALAQGGFAQEISSGQGASVGEAFGTSLASIADLDGDGLPETIIGAPNAAPAGRVVIRTSSGAIWLQLNGASAGDEFGFAVAAVGDQNGDGVEDFAVSAPNGNRVSVFSGSNGTQIWTMPGPTASRFGHALDSIADQNGDGRMDLLVGASEASPAGLNQAGQVELLSGNNGAIVRSFAGNEAGARMGIAVAAVGDLNGDGIDDLLIGSDRSSAGGRNEGGTIFVHSGQSGVLLLQVDGAGSLDHFGASVDSAGDINGDGIADFLVGAPDERNGGANQAGAVYSLSGNNGNVLQVIRGEVDQARLGSSVAGGLDWDGDGIPDLAMGAAEQNNGGTSQAGSIYIYSSATDRLLHQVDGTQLNGQMGFAMTTADHNADGFVDLLFSTPGTSFGGSYSIIEFAPLLTLASYTLSGGGGGLSEFFINFPDSEAGQDYIMLGSLSAPTPWFIRNGIVPLTRDAYTDQLLFSTPSSFTGLRGTLGASGNGLSQLDLAPGGLANDIGTRAWFAAVSHDAGGVRMTSIAQYLDIVP